VLALITRCPHHAMQVGMKDTSTEDGEGVANIADRMAGKRLCVFIVACEYLLEKSTSDKAYLDIGPLCVARRHDLQPTEPMVQNGLTGFHQ
jgi:hypothetical protein